MIRKNIYLFLGHKCFPKHWNQHFVNLTNLNAWLFLRCFLDSSYGDVHWEFITNVAKGTLDIQFHCLVKTKASTSIQNHDQPLWKQQQGFSKVICEVGQYLQKKEKTLLSIRKSLSETFLWKKIPFEAYLMPKSCLFMLNL